MYIFNMDRWMKLFKSNLMNTEKKNELALNTSDLSTKSCDC